MLCFNIIEVIVSNSRLNVYGAGRTLEEAINEFSSMLIDLYEELEASKDVLSYSLRQQLDYIKEGDYQFKSDLVHYPYCSWADEHWLKSIEALTLEVREQSLQ